MNNLNDFSDILRKRAHWTHEIIHRGVSLQLGIMEETITDMHLLTIADEFKDFVITKKFSRREEGSKSGADWLWLIGEPGSWLPLLVQAKIINPKTGNCQRLDYNGGEQRKKLLMYARQHRLVPIYCIYSFIPLSFQPPISNDNHIRKREDWACSFISPRTVRLLSSQGLKNQDDILRFSIPWMDPFYQASSDKDKVPVGQAIANSIISLRDGFENTHMKMIDTNVESEKNIIPNKRTNWENLDTGKAVRQMIPQFICKMLKDTCQNMQVPLCGMNIISTIPIQKIPELNFYSKNLI